VSKSFSVAVFAHNEERTLAATLGSILTAGEARCCEIVVLANGCVDRTVAIARDCASRHANIRVIEIELADKANAWNHYVHEVSPTPPFCDAELHVFVDGDVQLKSGTFDAFSAALEQYPSMNAVGALPTSGRDKEAWRQRMIANGTLSGGLYALSADFLQRIRQREVLIPRGFIGEDWAVSLFAQSNLKPLNAVLKANTNIVFALDGGFSFRSLSLWRLRDYRTYIRRLWRYSLRGVQYEMLVGLLQHYYPEELPKDIDGLYLQGTPPSRLKWVGATSILRFTAVQKVRLVRKALIRTSG
jgi:glycosyltransferase involved in cell wall biosynthesis